MKFMGKLGLCWSYRRFRFLARLRANSQARKVAPFDRGWGIDQPDE